MDLDSPPASSRHASSERHGAMAVHIREHDDEIDRGHEVDEGSTSSATDVARVKRDLAPELRANLAEVSFASLDAPDDADARDHHQLHPRS